MHCNICGSDDAHVRFCEIETALITGRAHIDCRGHSEYRHVDNTQISESLSYHTEKRVALLSDALNSVAFHLAYTRTQRATIGHDEHNAGEYRRLFALEGELQDLLDKGSYVISGRA